MRVGGMGDRERPTATMNVSNGKHTAKRERNSRSLVEKEESKRPAERKDEKPWLVCVGVRVVLSLSLSLVAFTA